MKMNTGNHDAPEYGSERFTCPNCQAYAHHAWNEIRQTGGRDIGYALTMGLRIRREISR